MKDLFTLLQILTGIAVFAAFVILSAFVFIQSAWAFAKESAGAVASVAVLFTSGFQKSLPVKASGLEISPLQIGLALLFISMMVAVFMPDVKGLLHAVAVLTVAAGGWLVWGFVTAERIDVVFVPFMAMWMIYYGFCLYRPVTP